MFRNVETVTLVDGQKGALLKHLNITKLQKKGLSKEINTKEKVRSTHEHQQEYQLPVIMT